MANNIVQRLRSMGTPLAMQAAETIAAMRDRTAILDAQIETLKGERDTYQAGESSALLKSIEVEQQLATARQQVESLSSEVAACQVRVETLEGLRVMAVDGLKEMSATIGAMQAPEATA